MLFVVKINRHQYITEATDAGSAALRADEEWRGYEKQTEFIEVSGGLDEYEADLLKQYDVKRINKATALDYMKRRLDGDQNIGFIL